jgi:BirA family biotin operon repressor/biotin-[acetyl-CoA-carboxylase] ligase
MDYTQIGNKIIYLSVVDSTNNYVASLLNEGKIESGTVVLAERQEKGRGQRGNSWQTEAGKNLTASLFLRHNNLTIRHQFKLSMIVSIAICKYLRQLDIQAEIKWPNDILVNQKKISGILIENQLQKENVTSSIIGIGLNVNQQEFNGIFATSLLNEIGKETKIQWVCLQLFQLLSEEFGEKMNWSMCLLLSEYYSLLYGYQQFVPVTFLATSENTSIKILGVHESGLLKIELLNEEKRDVDLKEIRFDFHRDNL